VSCHKLLSGELSGIDNTQVFSSVTIPPVTKTVVRNGHTLVYRFQNAAKDQELPSERQSHFVSRDATTFKLYNLQT
jgi:hypothetical protein